MRRTFIGVVAFVLLITMNAGFVPARSEAVFNPMLPFSNIQHGQSIELPLSVFGDEIGNIPMYQGLSHNQTQYQFWFQGFGGDKRDTYECLFDQFYITDESDDGILALNPSGAIAFEDIGLIVSADHTRYDGNNQYSTVSFFDYSTQQLIGRQEVIVPNSARAEVLSRRYFTTDGTNLWDIKTGWVDCVKDGLYGFSTKTYYRSGNVYNRFDDSFMFRLNKPELKDFTFLAIQDEDFVFLAHDKVVDDKSSMDDIIKLNFKGKIVQQWKIGYFEPFMDSIRCLYIRGNQAMIYYGTKEKPSNYRLYNLDDRGVVWDFHSSSAANEHFTFADGTFYYMNSDTAVRIKPDGTKTYVYFPVKPQYITLNGQQYCFIGIPGSDPENLQCRLVRLEEDGEVETDLVVPCYQNYIADGKRLVGWDELNKFWRNEWMIPYEYCIQDLTDSGFSKPKKFNIELPENNVSVDFVHLKAVQLIDGDRAKIIDFSDSAKNHEISIIEPNETAKDFKNISVLLRDNLLALYRTDTSGNDTVDCVSVYGITTGKRIVHQKLKAGQRYVRTDAWLTSIYKTDNLCMTNNVLIAWRKDKTQIHIITIPNNELIIPNANDQVYEFNDRVYYRVKDKFIILNPETLEKKDYDSTKVRSVDPLDFLWLEQYGQEQVFDKGVSPQRSIPGILNNRVGNWFSFDTNFLYECNYVQIKPCPTFSIKRISNDEFQITNTSPNCQTPLKAKVFLVPWPDDWCPPFWQARNVVRTIENLNLNEVTTLKIADLNLVRSGKFALVVESNGLLDTRKSELSSFDKEKRPLFDGMAISYSEQKSVVLTLWENK